MLGEFSNSWSTYRNRTISDFVELEGINKLVNSRMVLQIVLVSQLRFKSNWWRTWVGVVTGVPPVEGHRLTFGVTTTDAARTVQCRTFPSEQVVRMTGTCNTGETMRIHRANRR